MAGTAQGAFVVISKISPGDISCIMRKGSVDTKKRKSEFCQNVKQSETRRKKMKKLFAILMSVLMIACFMPTMAFADGEDTPAAGEESKNPVAQVGDQTYASLSAAVEAVETNGTATITLLKDATEDITISANKKVTLNLNGKKLTNSSNDTITVANGAEVND